MPRIRTFPVPTGLGSVKRKLLAVSPRPMMLVDEETCWTSVGTEGGSAPQATTTLVTGALPTVPEPPDTVQLCAGLAGWVATVTE